MILQETFSFSKILHRFSNPSYCNRGLKNADKTLLILCLTLCNIVSISAQKTNNTTASEYILNGTMGVQGGESFSFRLELKDSVGNFLSGYAYTYENPKKDVKAYVVATIDRNNKTLNLLEKHIVYNNNFYSRALICLVESALTYKPTERNLSGVLSTMTSNNGAECSKGSIFFSDAGEIDHLFGVNKPTPTVANPAEKLVVTAPEKLKVVKVVYDTVSKSPVVNRPQENNVSKPLTVTITEGKDKGYHWKTDTIIFSVWDGNTVDNDKISVLYNGVEVLKEYSLTKTPKVLHLPVGGNELNMITIVAINEGADPPNTANILLQDGDDRYEVVAHNTVGKKAIIRIIKK
jgi:hypothetical protein